MKDKAVVLCHDYATGCVFPSSFFFSLITTQSAGEDERLLISRDDITIMNATNFPYHVFVFDVKL